MERADDGRDSANISRASRKTSDTCGAYGGRSGRATAETQ
jgi:hypothetical protein